MTKKIDRNLFSRLTTKYLKGSVIGQTLALAAVITVVGTALLQITGMAPKGIGPWSFVGTLVLIKLSFISFWPAISARHPRVKGSLKEAFGPGGWLDPAALFSADRRHRPAAMALWNQKDPRLDMSLFNGTVPTFVLTADNIILDWNPAFDLIFGRISNIRRGVHISSWFDCLDNFRNVAKRSAKLYGEGILPITDRERVTYVSDEFGRMVFTKIMTPIVERTNGRIIGWNIVLNINSANKRQEFFEALFARIHAQTQAVRYAASFDSIFGRFTEYQKLMSLHRSATAGAQRVLDVATGTGGLAIELAQDHKSVTAVDEDVERLRQLRLKRDIIGGRIRIVRRSHDSFGKTPVNRYDAITLMLGVDRFMDPKESLFRLMPALKPGGIISVSALKPQADIDAVMAQVRSELETAGEYERIKNQFNHVLEFEKSRCSERPERFHTAEEIQDILIGAGYSEILEVVDGVWGGQGVFVTARKPV